jgi:hypothetical protein
MWMQCELLLQAKKHLGVLRVPRQPMAMLRVPSRISGMLRNLRRML